MAVFRYIINRLIGAAGVEQDAGATSSVLIDRSTLADFVRLLQEIDAEDAAEAQEILD